MNFYEKSLTVEAWIYPFTICTGYPYIDSIIYAQSSFSPSTRIMWMMLRNGKNYGAFQGNDAPGSTMFATNQWHHMAFTYNYSTLTQTVYVNGVIGNHFICSLVFIFCYYSRWYTYKCTSMHKYRYTTGNWWLCIYARRVF